MLEQIERQMYSMGQTEYEIVKMKRMPGALKNLYISDIRTIEDMSKHIDKYIYDVQQRKENLYIRAIPDYSHPVIFLDDMNEESLNFLISKGINPCCTVQTSIKQGNPSFHVWLKLCEDVDRPIRKVVEYYLIKELHEQFPNQKPGDFGSNDGGHLGRLAGSWNFGLLKQKNNPVVLVSSDGCTLSPQVTQMLLAESSIYIDQCTNKKIDNDLHKINLHEYENPKIIKYFKENVIPKMNANYPHYQQDLFAAGKLLYAGFSEMDVKKVLLEHDPNPISTRKPEREALFLSHIINQCQDNTSQNTTKPNM